MPLPREPLRNGGRIGTIVILAGVYFIAAKLGLRLAFVHPSATPVWPPTGIALAGLLVIGYRAWPGIFLGAFLANLTTAGTVWTSLGIATGNTLEGLAGTYLVNTYAGGRNAFDRAQDIFKFAALAALVGTMVSATIGVTSLALGGVARWADYRPIWFTWWLGDAAGALIAAPVLILWSTNPRLRWARRDLAERLLFLVAIVVISWIVFGHVFAFAYLTVPLLVWAAFRFGQRDTASVIAILSGIAVWSTVRGLGPFVGTTPNESLLLLQTFMGIMAVVALPLASVVADRTRIAMENARRMAAEQRAREAAERAADRTARLQAVTSALSEAVSREQVVNVILSQGIQALGARAGFVSTLSPNGAALELVGSVGYPAEFVSTLERVPLSATRPMTEVMKTGIPLFFESEAVVRAQFPDFNTPLEDVARAIVPMSVAGRRSGVLTFGFRGPRTFDHDEQGFMITLAGQCAQALERAQLYEHERRVAKTLQQAFLPAALPDVPGVKIDAVYVPGTSESEVGGDWYDVFHLPDGRIACSVGDAVGSGLQAAMIMGQVRQSIRATALETSDPSGVLDRAGQVLRLTYGATAMATATFGILDPVSLTFTYATAGHPPPVVAMPDLGARPLAAGGVPLGLGAKPTIVRTVSLVPGALLALYTDGLIESTRNLAEGEERLLAAIRTELDSGSSSPAKTLLGRVVAIGEAGDDIAIVTISIARERVAELALTLPAEPASLREVRQAVRLLEQGLGVNKDTAFRVQVLLGEAVNNAVEHAYGATRGVLHLRVWRDADVLRLEVSDQGRWRAERRGGTGHGLNIMRSLADTVEVDRHPTGTTVRLSVRLPQAPVPSAPPPRRGAPADERERISATVGDGEALVSRPPQFHEGAFEVQHVQGIPVVDVSGDIDMSNTRQLEETLEQAARMDKRAVVVSLARVAFLDSKAIHSLMRFGQRLATNRQRLLLVIGRDRPVRRIVEITGLAEAFPVFESVDDAIAGATAPP